MKNNEKEFQDTSEIKIIFKNTTKENETTKSSKNIHMSDLKINDVKNLDLTQKEIFKTTEPNPSCSTSLLEIPSFLNEPSNRVEPEKQELPTVNIIPAFHDSSLHDFTFLLPKFTSYIFNPVKHISIKYQFTDSVKILVNTINGNLIEINTLNYGDQFIFDQKNIFIFNRSNFVKKEKRREGLEYKKSIVEKTKYVKNDILKKYKNELFEAQIKNKLNFYYIEDYQDLIRAFKSIIFVKNKNYEPKVKCFDENQQGEYFEYCFKKMPWIGNNIGNCLRNKFDNFKDLSNFLKENSIADYVVQGENGERKIGEKQEAIIKRIFLSKNPDEKVYN